MYYHFANKDDILTIRNLVHYLLKNKEEFYFVEQFDNSPYITTLESVKEFTDIMKPYRDMYK